MQCCCTRTAAPQRKQSEHHSFNAQQTLIVPGEYDPKLVQGWKADPKSAFVGDTRFRSQELSESEADLALTAGLSCDPGLGLPVPLPVFVAETIPYNAGTLPDVTLQAPPS